MCRLYISQGASVCLSICEGNLTPPNGRRDSYGDSLYHTSSPYAFRQTPIVAHCPRIPNSCLWYMSLLAHYSYAGPELNTFEAASSRVERIKHRQHYLLLFILDFHFWWKDNDKKNVKIEAHYDFDLILSYRCLDVYNIEYVSVLPPWCYDRWPRQPKLKSEKTYSLHNVLFA